MYIHVCLYICIDWISYPSFPGHDELTYAERLSSCNNSIGRATQGLSLVRYTDVAWWIITQRYMQTLHDQAY